MPQKTLDGKDVSENNDLWEEGTFMQTISQKEMEEKMHTFHMKHNEEMNYNCKKCKMVISAHNHDWHDCLCDTCFDKMVEND